MALNKPIIKKESKPRGKEVGVFLIMIAAVLLLLGSMFALGFINEMVMLFGVLAILAFIYKSSPQLVIELEEYERAVILRYGAFHKVAGPGWVFVLPMVDDPRVVDLRVQTADVEPQEVLTKDNVTLKIDAIIYYKVANPKAAVLNVEDPTDAVLSFVRAHLRDVVGKMELESVISQINIINDLLRKSLEKITEDWGIEVVKVEIQSIELPPDVLKSMHRRKEAEQWRMAQEERARGQAIRIDAIRQSAGKLTDPALQYLYLQALEKVAEGRSSKIIFPIELTHLAERLSSRMGPKVAEKVSEDLREKYDEFVLEETREGRPVDTQEILSSLRKKASSVKTHAKHKT
ncbi:MAG: hypothetical protein JW834_02215 [Candidatus Diapherotrites archaeon]|nr:hypothetical protein [Candidatus Diapherotrites archaeon]